MKLLYISLLSLAFLPCAAMNQSSSHDGIFYLVEASDGQLVELPESVIRRLKVLNDCFNDQEENELHKVYGIIKEKITGKAEKQHKRFFSLIDKERKLDLFVSNELLQEISDCLRGIKKVKQLDPKKIYELFEAADCLGAPRAFLRKLTLYARKQLPKDKQHPLIRSGHYFNTIKSLINDGYFAQCNQHNYLLTSKDQNNNNIITLQLSGLQLDSLKGIEEISRFIDCSLIDVIRFDSNRLEKVDLSRLWKLFPQLKQITLAYNKIWKVCLSIPYKSYKMPFSIKIDLSHNKLKRITGILSEGSTLTIKGNATNGLLKNCLADIYPFAYSPKALIKTGNNLHVQLKMVGAFLLGCAYSHFGCMTYKLISMGSVLTGLTSSPLPLIKEKKGLVLIGFGVSLTAAVVQFGKLVPLHGFISPQIIIK